MAHFSSPEAFQLGPIDGPRVLLFHGLTGAPIELWPLGYALACAGYRVEAPRWKGHGTRVESLLDVQAGDLVAQAREVTAAASPVAIVGLSMGALLATVAAGACPRLHALVLLAPAVRLAGPNALFEQVGRLSPRSLGRTIVKKRPGVAPVPADEFSDLGSEVRNGAARAALTASFETPESARYDSIPLRWAVELHAIRGQAQQAAGEVRAPVLLLHGRLDRTAHPESSLLAARWFRSECHVRFFQRSPHVLTLGPERGLVAAEVTEFLFQRIPTTSAAQSA
jgi:esterase/lipase